MNTREELVLRCAHRRNQKIGPLSSAAFEELLQAVRSDPAAYVDTDAEQAYAILDKGLSSFFASQQDDDLLDDDQYMAAREKRFLQLVDCCNRAIACDAGCLDAHLVYDLAKYQQPDELLDALLELEGGLGEDEPDGASDIEHSDWTNVWDRPRLRLRAAIARTCADGARWRMALDAAESVMDATEKDGDPLGARFTAALAYARLEDEDGFNKLDARFLQRGNTWANLARCILLYKLDRMSAARRALRGYAQLCEGAAYALLRPIYVEIYLPDRPDYAPASFEEALCAVHEAEPIIADTPDFIAWTQSQQWFVDAAKAFADKRDLDW